MTDQPATTCEDKIEYLTPQIAWLDHLRSEYAVEGTSVIVDATPIPDCDKNFAWLEQHFNGVIDDSPLPVQPVSSYIANTSMHMNDAGSLLVSKMIAGQINSRLHSAPSGAEAVKQ